MGAVGIHHTATDDGAWDGPANEARLRSGEGPSYYRRAFAWQDPEGDPETKTAWRFIHHMVGGDGNPGAASTKACSAGIAILNGGRGGTTIPDSDRRGVWSHLTAHLRDADLEPPELKSARDLAELDTERRISLQPMEIRETADGSPLIAGYAAVFNQWSDDLGGFVERIAPGFFGPVLGSDVRALWQHEPGKVLGRTTNGTLRLAEDGTGLAVEISPPDSQWARDAMVSIRRGDVSQMSFGFQVAEDRWEAQTGQPSQRTLLRAAALLDVSPVTFPAYPQTSVSVRQRLADLRAGVEAVKSQVEDLAQAIANEEISRAREDLKRRIKIRQREV